MISNFFMYIALVDCHADLFAANATHDRARVKDYKQSNTRKGYPVRLQSRAPHQSQSRKPKSPNNHNQLKMPRVQRPARSLVVILGKREVWMRQIARLAAICVLSKKMGSLSPQSLPAFQS